MAVQDGPNSIRVTWTPPSPLGDTTGYRISYTAGGGSSDSVDVDDGNTNSHTLIWLTHGETYSISIRGISSIFSAPVEAGTVTLQYCIAGNFCRCNFVQHGRVERVASRNTLYFNQLFLPWKFLAIL